ncbi:hypothetical protein GCM10010191_46390 [Actinomadura vinacea]|uniref:DUF6458 domain-containing protein n=1 Tax=Actinomadura vinacea TaxID=115336 RepID=A0ABN3JH12_9ACTN
MPVAAGTALLTVGAILTFALTGSLRGLDLHTVGVILMLAGAAGLVLPLLTGTRSRPNRLRSWPPGRPPARSRQDAIDDAIDDGNGDGNGGVPRTRLVPRRREPSHDDGRRARDGHRRWRRTGRR